MRIFKVALIAVMVCLMTVSLSFGKEPLTVKPESVGMSSDQLKNIDEQVKKYIDSENMAGAVVLVARHGKIAYLKAFGNAEKEKNKPMTTDAIFLVASMTKALTATSILQLVDQGKILLTDPISAYVPEFAKPQVAVQDKNGKIKLVKAKREITFHDLLTMTSGIGCTRCFGTPAGDFVTNLMIQAKIKDGMAVYDGTIGDETKNIAGIPLMFQPGEGFNYSDPGVIALGHLVEVISGMSLDKYMEKNIFKPLGMSDTCFFEPKSKLSRVADYYYGHDGKNGKKGDKFIKDYLGPYAEYEREMSFTDKQSFFAPCAGIHSTAADWMSFVQMLLNGGVYNGKRLLSKQAVKLMTTNQIGEKVFPFWNNRWGYMVDIQEDNVADMPNDSYMGGEGAFGWVGFYGTRWFANPNEDTVMVFMTHVYWFFDVSPLQNKIAHIINRAVID